MKIVAGGRTVYTFNQIADMEDAAEELGAEDEGAIAVVFDYSDEDEDEVVALDIYEFDGTEFVSYTDSPISFLDMIDRLVAAEETVGEVETDAAAGAAHAEINNGSNPHGTTYANIVSKPTTWSGLGITEDIPADLLPSYVDDVIEGIYVNSTTFTVSGNTVTPETGKIYVSTSGTEDGKVYRWSGSQYVVVSDTLALGNTITTAFRGDLGINAYNWADNAFGWGNHANAGYLTSYSETDPVFTASNAAGITATDKGNWNNAYSWGNHANAGYINASSTLITNLSNAINSTNNNVANKVDTSTTIANIALTNNISAANLTANLPEATNLAKGLMSSTDKTNLDALQALMEDGDGNNIVDKITDVLDVFENYPEGTNIVTALNGKLDANFANIADWDNAYSWGNHANAGYLTTEADTLDTVVARGSVTNNATINYITTTRTDYNTTATDGYATGQVGWNSNVGTIDIGLYNGGTLHTGQETLYFAKADENITIGDVVQFNNAVDGIFTIKKAVPELINEFPYFVMGVATQNIAINDKGYVTTFGVVKGVNTSAIGFMGQILWYDANTSNSAGRLTTQVPTAPNAKIQIGVITKSGTTDGEVLVRVGNPTSLAFDSAVELANVANGEVLGYNGTSGRWENVEVTSLGINVALTNVANGQVFVYDNGIWRNNNLTVYGSVNSVGLNMPTGFTVANSPITDSGTLGVTYAEGYSLPATSTQDTWNSAYGWGNHQAVGYMVGLAADSVTDGNIAAWNGTTGKLLKDTGVAITAVATTDYVNSVVGDIETILDDIIG
jgi:hypothetical protein